MASPARTQRHLRAGEGAVLVLAVLAAIAAAKVAEPFLVPVVMGLMLSYALEPVVEALARIHVHRAIGGAIILLLLGAAVAGLGFLVREDAALAIAQLPDAARKLRIAAHESARGPSPMGHVREAAAELNKAAAEASGSPSSPPPAADVGGVGKLQNWLASQSADLLEVLGEIGIALMLAYFLLAQGDHLRRKVVHLAGPTLAARRVTVEILDDIHAQIQRYLLVMLIVNTLVGLGTWGVLALFGIERAALWGAIAAVLHVIPYAGTALTMAGAGIIAFVQFGSVAQALVVALCVMAVAAIFGLGLASWLQGRASRMSSLAVLLAILFFGWLWGPWGLLFGAPLIAVMKTAADRIPSLQPIGELLGG